jgi:hypothetical protein
MFSMKEVAMAALLMVGAVLVTTPALADNYEVDITISNLGDFNLGAFDIDVSYDDTKLSLASYPMLTTELGAINGIEASDWSLGDDEVGTVNIALVSYLDYELDAAFFAAQSNDFVLATLTFDADAESDLDGITLSYVDLSDEYGDAIPFNVSGTDINVVPVPAAAWLLGSGLIGLAGLRRRNRK